MFAFKTLVLAVSLILASTPLLKAEEEVLPDEILAQVGSLQLTSSYLSQMIEVMQPQIKVMLRSNPEMKKELIKQWVDINLLAKEAITYKLDQLPEVDIKIQEMRNRILVEALLNKRLDRQSPISREEITEYYDKHSQEFIRGEQVKAQHILIRVEADANESEQNDARERIDMIVKKLDKGEDFASLAQEYSEDPGSKDSGGNLGYFGRGQMVKEFEDAAFATEPGKTSPPVQTGFGWHLIHISDKKPSKQLPLEQVSKQIKAKLRAIRNEKALKNLLEELKEKYTVAIY
ncbi:MAG: peptidylprolyl isomerase [Desulfobulbaceae bacterium]|nr:peptidylprolyl isomerase [Desulfobulbaceae bacterium]